MVGDLNSVYADNPALCGQQDSDAAGFDGSTPTTPPRNTVAFPALGLGRQPASSA